MAHLTDDKPHSAYGPREDYPFVITVIRSY